LIVCVFLEFAAHGVENIGVSETLLANLDRFAKQLGVLEVQRIYKAPQRFVLCGCTFTLFLRVDVVQSSLAFQL